MNKQRIVLGMCCAMVLALGACSRQQSDWQKTRETNTADAYEQFLKKYPSGEFTAQAQARVKELYEERDWQKARDADTPDAYQAFLKQYPEGRWTEEARIRVENFTLAQAPSGGPAAVSAATAPPASETGTDATSPTPTPAGAAPPTVQPAPAARAPAAQKPAVTAMADPTARKHVEKTKATGSYGVQLGAFKSGPKAANSRWAHLQKTYPTLLAGLSSKVTAKKTADGHLYRLQATGLSEKHAREVCSALKARAQACVVVPPAHG